MPGPVVIEVTAELVALVENLRTLRTEALIALIFPWGVHLCIVDCGE